MDRGPSERTGMVNLQAGKDRRCGFGRIGPLSRFVVGMTTGDFGMIQHIYAPPYAAVDELPMVHGGLPASSVVAAMMGLDLHPVLAFDG